MAFVNRRNKRFLAVDCSGKAALSQATTEIFLKVA
jgi:hypothetical protein